MQPHDTTNEIPYGYCHCGCGQKTNLAKHNNPRKGYAKGQPTLYLRGHVNRRRHITQVLNPSGMCMCGCGQPAPIAKTTSSRDGVMKGHAFKYIHGHNSYGPPVEDRFWAKVNKHGPVHLPLGTECWLWTGSTVPFGHGQFNVGDHVRQLTHRFSWELHYGPIPIDIQVCHHCDIPNCVRPDHLFLGTQRDNVQDAISKGRPGYLDWRRSSE